MKANIKSVFTRALALAAMFVIGSARAAATPVAVWEGEDLENPKAVGSITADLNGNSYGDGAITIGDKPIIVTLGSGFADYRATVIVKYSNITANPTESKSLMAFKCGDVDNRMGILAESSGAIYGIYKGVKWNNGSNVSAGNLNITEGTHRMSMVVAMTAYGTGGVRGTHAYIDDATVYDVGGLVDANQPIQVAYIGGENATTLPVMTGMKISSIAVFNAALTKDEIAAYKFPSEKEYPTAKATISGEMDWSAIEFDPALEGNEQDVELTIEGETTLTIDNLIVNQLGALSILGEGTLTVENAETLKFAGIIIADTVTDLDFNFDATTTSIDASNWMPVIKAVGDKVIFKFVGEGENGVILNNGDANNGTQIATHIIFAGGTHSMTYRCENASLKFGANATPEKPTILITEGATLNFNARNLCGWTSGASNANGIIKVDDGSTLNLIPTDGTMYWAQQFYLMPGATFNFTDDGGNFRVNGGVIEDAAQFYVPASEDLNFAKPAVINQLGSTGIMARNEGNVGVGIFVGENSKLTINSAVAPQEGTVTVTKFGKGEIEVADGQSFTAPLVVNDGIIALTGAEKFGDVTVTTAVSYDFPEGTEVDQYVSICTGTLNAPAKVLGKTVYINGEPLDETYTLVYDTEEGGSVAYSSALPEDYIEDDEVTIDAINSLFDQTVTEDTDVVVRLTSESDLVTMFFQDGDELFEHITKVFIVREGDLALDVAPGCEELLNKFDFSGVTGNLFAGCGVINVNFNSASGSFPDSAEADGMLAGGTPKSSWNNVTGAEGSITTIKQWDTLVNSASTLQGTKIAWKSNTTWDANQDVPILKGYLDDGGTGTIITISDIPYAMYDIIVYLNTDMDNRVYNPIEVNAVPYTWDANEGKTVIGSSNWGATTRSGVEYGKNALRIADIKGNSTIHLGVRNDGASVRDCICAMQIVQVPYKEFKNVYDAEEGEDVKISTLNEYVKTGEEYAGLVTLNLKGGNLILDAAFDCMGLSVNSTGDVIIKTDGVYVPSAAEIAKIAQGNIAGSVTWEGIAQTVLATRLGGAIYTVGVGSEEAPIPFTLNVQEGEMTLKDGEFYIGETFNATTSTVNFVDAKIHVINELGFGVGQAIFNVGGASEITTERLILSQGGADRKSVFNLSDSAVVNVTGEMNVDVNTASIMFGHWNGPSTFTIEDDAVFNAPKADILIGKTYNNHTINLNGGTMTVHGIKASSNATGINNIVLNGGALNIGAGGITSYSTNTTLALYLFSSSTISALDSCAISQGMTIGTGETGATLTIDVAEEKDAILTSEIYYAAGDGVSIKKTGEGRLEIYSELNNFMENGGKLIVEGGEAVTPAGNEGTVEVTGGAIYLALTLEQAVDGYVAEGVTVPAGEKVFFIKPDGSVVEGTGDKGNVFEGIGIVWTGSGETLDWSDGNNWKGNVAPGEGDYAIFPENAETEVMINNGDTCAEILVKGDITFNLNSDVMIDSQIITVTDTGSAEFTGEGTIVGDGVKPTLALSEGWTGTVWLKNLTFNDWGTFEEYGNASSKVKMTGIIGYAKSALDVKSVPEIVLEDEGEGDTKVYALTVNNGYSSGASYIFGKVSGTGTFRFNRSDSSRPTQTYIFEDVEDFEGKIGDVGGLKVVIGEATGTDFTASAINYLNGAKVAAGLGWLATRATFGETLTVVGSEGDVVVTVAEEPTTAMPAVTLYGEGEGWTLEYDAETGNIKVVKSGEAKMGTMMYLR